MNADRTTALAKLLQDDDPKTEELLREQLALAPDEWSPQLERLAATEDRRVSAAAKRFLEEIQRSAAEEDFELLCRFFPENGNLEDACWLLATTVDPEADVGAAKKLVNEWGRALLLKTASATSAKERIGRFADFFCGELGFRGNCEDYYNESNSILPRVIETRKGLPITLSCLAVFLSHRAGMNVVGINLPGHFIARHGGILFDPFNACRILREADCGEILRCQGVEPTPDCFAVASSRRTLQRILSNLRFAYARNHKPGMANKVANWLVALRR